MANSKSKSASKDVAVILSGCGACDGSSIHETVFIQSNLTRNGLQPVLFAPDIPQFDVFDHVTTKEEVGNRNVLIESARLCPGKINPITSLVNDVDKYCALIIPGGFGVVKNLCDFALKGAEMSVQKDVAFIIKAFYKAKKPIGLCCSSSILVSKLIPGVTITLGKSSGDEWPCSYLVEGVKKMGAINAEKGVNEFVIDSTNNVYSTPAFMYGPAEFHEVDDALGDLVKAIVKSF